MIALLLQQVNCSGSVSEAGSQVFLIITCTMWVKMCWIIIFTTEKCNNINKLRSVQLPLDLNQTVEFLISGMWYLTVTNNVWKHWLTAIRWRHNKKEFYSINSLIAGSCRLIRRVGLFSWIPQDTILGWICFLVCQLKKNTYPHTPVTKGTAQLQIKNEYSKIATSDLENHLFCLKSRDIKSLQVPTWDL